ncbi:MAG: HD domain-containing phosphohydrolase [Candidatus Eutrophobiaceae bacterium]
MPADTSPEEYSQREFADLLSDLNRIGVALSAEDNIDKLLDLIVTSAMRITSADGSTLYLMENDNELCFAILHNTSLNEHKGGTSGNPIDLYPVKLYNEKGQANDQMVSASAVLNRKTINIPDAYNNEEFDFSGTRNIDAKRGYHSSSFLTVPMTNHEDTVIGVLQLINAMDSENNIIPFSRLQQTVVESLASQAAVALTKRSLIEGQKRLFDSLIQLIADAIDEKSPYTAGHCRRVPVLTRMLAEAACRSQSDALKDFSMTEEEMYELDVAAWLHDCGKITTPEFVVDKATKLETIFDRVAMVEERYNLMQKEKIIEKALAQLKMADTQELLDNDTELRDEWQQMKQELDCVRRCNIGGEMLSEADAETLKKTAQRQWVDVHGHTQPLLDDKELDNLLISRGTLSASERKVINSHVNISIKMLKSLPYPKHLQRVPEYAGGHHEKMDGTGYPNRLKGEQMSLPARMLAIADIFEALTAKDRPYKKAMPLSKTLKILKQMRDNGHIDPHLYEAFIQEKIYIKYAKEHLAEEQIDFVEENSLL